LEARFETIAVVSHLSQSTGQDELLATQSPDGSLVFSAVLKDVSRGLLSFLLVPPFPNLKEQKRRAIKVTGCAHPDFLFTFAELGSSN
jgi:hypothetical protein